MSIEELLSWFIAGLFALAVGLPLFKSYFRFGSEDEDVENCGLPENYYEERVKAVWDNAVESQKLIEKWKIEHRLLYQATPRWGGGEVTVTSNRCNYCGTKNEQNHGTCCKCGAPL